MCTQEFQTLLSISIENFLSFEFSLTFFYHSQYQIRGEEKEENENEKVNVNCNKLNGKSLIQLGEEKQQSRRF